MATDTAAVRATNTIGNARSAMGSEIGWNRSTSTSSPINRNGTAQYLVDHGPQGGDGAAPPEAKRAALLV